MPEELELRMPTMIRMPSVIRADLDTADIRGEIELAIADVERKIQELEAAKAVDADILQREITI